MPQRAARAYGLAASFERGELRWQRVRRIVTSGLLHQPKEGSAIVDCNEIQKFVQRVGREAEAFMGKELVYMSQLVNLCPNHRLQVWVRDPLFEGINRRRSYLGIE
jgi:hypothetical protein